MKNITTTTTPLTNAEKKTTTNFTLGHYALMLSALLNLMVFNKATT